MNFDFRKRGPSCPNWGHGGGGVGEFGQCPKENVFFSIDLFPSWHGSLWLTNREAWIMTLRSVDLQSDVFTLFTKNWLCSQNVQYGGTALLIKFNNVWDEMKNTLNIREDLPNEKCTFFYRCAKNPLTPSDLNVHVANFIWLFLKYTKWGVV